MKKKAPHSELLKEIKALKKELKTLKAGNKEPKVDFFEKHMRDLFWTTDISGNLTYISPSVKKLLGYSPEELRGTPCFELMTKESIKRAFKLKPIFADPKGKVPLIELDYLHKNGLAIPYSVGISVVRDRSGMPITIQGVSRDISDKRKTEEELKKSRQRLYHHVQKTPLGVIEWDLDFRVAEWNPAAEKIFGFTRDEVLGKVAYSIVPEDERDFVGKKWENLLKKKGGMRSSNDNITKDGRRIECEWYNTPLIDADGEVFGVASMVQDITEERKAKQKLAESEEHYRSVVESSRDGIAIVSKEGRLLLANKGLASMLGHKPSDMEGKHFADFTHPNAHPIAFDAFQKFYGEGKNKLLFEASLIHKNGKEIPIEDQVSSISVNGERAALLIIRDTRERKKDKEALQKANVKLADYAKKLQEVVDVRTSELDGARTELVAKEKLAVLGQLAGGIGHELRNPLGIMSNSIYCLEKFCKECDIPNTEKAKRYMGVIKTQIKNADDIIGALLGLSRTRPVDITDVDPDKLVRETIQRVSMPNDVKVRYKLQDDLPSINVDAKQIIQVLYNLIINALHAMPKGGTLTLGAYKKSGKGVSISVADTGSGIPRKILGNIFEPLYSTKARGFGLGLALAKKLVELNEGTISVKTADDKGSTFTITFKP